MKTAERVVMIAIVLVLIGGVWGVRYAMQQNHQEVVEAVARGEYEIRPEPESKTESKTDQLNWRQYYPETIPLMIADVTVEASVADTLSERIQGLSGTPYLPQNVVKLFVFGTNGSHSIWMKDMNYALDIIWVSEEGDIVHIEENVAPETFPDSFGSPTPAWYVIEANAGFVEASGTVIGDKVSVE